MLPSFKPLRSLALAAGITSLSVVTAFAQVPQIAVPQPGNPGGGNGGVQGCYQINQQIYGPYWMSFCLNGYGSGSYQVTGGGLYCNGRLNWRNSGGDVRVSLRYSDCGGGVGWSADTLVCAPMRPEWPPYQGGPFNQPNAGPWNQPQIAVPGPQIAVPAPQPGTQSMRCSYYPAVRGFQPISVIADRTY